MRPTNHLDGDDQPAEPSDDQIIDAVRGGDIGDFALLWQRHVVAARRAARAISPSADPDDLVSEAFASILRVTKGGGGPSDGFRPYLLATLRNTAARWARGSGTLSIEVVSERELAPEGTDPIERISERSSVAAVFATLSPRHRTLLWYLEVEGMKPRELAPLMGLTPNAVSALAFRARDCFRRAWLEAHIHDPSRSDDCRWFCEQIVSRRERPVSAAAAARFRAHMRTCRGCQLVAAEVDTVSQRLRSILPVAILGGVAAGLYGGTDAPVAADVGAGHAPGPLTTHAGAISHAAYSSAGLPASGLAALVAAVVVVAGAVLLAGGVVSLSAQEHPSGASSVIDAARGIDDPPPSADPSDVPSSTQAAVEPTGVPTAVEPPRLLVFQAPAKRAAPASSETHSADEVSSDPTPSPAPGLVPDPALPPSGEGEPSVDSLTSAHEFRLARSIAQHTLVPPLIEGTGAPGAVVTVVDESGITLDTAAVADDGTFSLDVSGDLLRQGMTLRVQQRDPRTGATEWADAIGPLLLAVPAITVNDQGLCQVASHLWDECLHLRAEAGAWIELLDAQGRSQIVRMPLVADELILLDGVVEIEVAVARYIEPTTGRAGVAVALATGTR